MTTAHFPHNFRLSAAAALALALLAVIIDRRPQSRAARQAVVLLFVGLIAAYVATRTAAVPRLGEHREPFDAVGVGTKLIEAVGLVLAVESITERAMDTSVAEKGVLS
jgi:hypothetical protein